MNAGWNASVLDGDQIISDTAECTAEGQDTYRCGRPGHLTNVGTHHYLVDAPGRMIYSDTIRYGGRLMAVAVLSWELQPSDCARGWSSSTVTSLVGQGMVDEHRNGHKKTLDQLINWQSRRK